MKHLKRRICALLCALALLLPLAPPAAAMEVYFVAVNDRLRPLTTDTMPTMVGAVLYVPYTVFDSNVTGVNLGVGYAGKSAQNTFVIYSLKGTIIFDLSLGSSYDGEGNSYNAKAVIRHNTIYLPLFFVCNFLGLSCSYLNTDSAPLIRIKNGEEWLSDSVFIDAAALSPRYDRYVQSVTPQVQPPAETTAPPDPAEVTPPARAGVPVLLAFRCDGGGAASAVLDALDGTGVFALFLFRPEDLGKHSDLVRRAAGSGHAVGFLDDGGASDAAAEYLEEGNRALFAIARGTTRFAKCEGSAARRAELEEAGWLCWKSNTSGVFSGGTAYTAANTVITRLQRAASAVYLEMDDSERTAGALPGILRHLDEDSYTLRAVTETALLS